MSRKSEKEDQVVLTGIRPTGPLHLGHYEGALKEWLKLQEAGLECFFLLADVQALTTHSENPELLLWSMREVLKDWVAVGIDPTLENVHLVQQSAIQERHALSILLGMVAKRSDILRNPTLKAELESQTDASMGFFYYPVDQAADIEMVDPLTEGAEILVPVGEDQVPHVETTRDIVRAFNRTYGETLNLPQALVGEVGRLVGTDGDSKMSKSKGNVINLYDDLEAIKKAVSQMPIDPARSVRRGHEVPGDPDKAVAINYLRIFDPVIENVEEIETLYREGRIGDGEIKAHLINVLDDMIRPIRERRDRLDDVPFDEFVQDGNHLASARAGEVLRVVQDKMMVSSLLAYLRNG